MTVFETPMSGRRTAARNAAETRKKIVLAGLVVVLLALLAYELPKIMHRSSSTSTTASTSLPATATPAVTPAASTPLTAAEAKRLRLIGRMEAKDPFVPLIHDSTSSSSSSSSSAPAATRPAPAHAVRAGQSKPAVGKPVPFTPAAEPTAAVIWTNGQRQVVGLHQVFIVGDAQFRLVAVTKKAMRIEAVGGAFAGSKQAIRVRQGHPLKLANTATGVEYRLLFTRGTTEPSTVKDPAKTAQPTATTTTTTPASSSQNPGS